MATKYYTHYEPPAEHLSGLEVGCFKHGSLGANYTSEYTKAYPSTSRNELHDALIKIFKRCTHINPGDQLIDSGTNAILCKIPDDKESNK